ncbi:MAG: response regulator [Isosphaeraceae bacterium]
MGRGGPLPADQAARPPDRRPDGRLPHLARQAPAQAGADRRGAGPAPGDAGGPGRHRREGARAPRGPAGGAGLGRRRSSPAGTDGAQPAVQRREVHRRGGSIRLEAGRDGGDIRVSVEDNGIGIAPEMLPRIFEPFVQVDASLARSQGGLGIGLTLVRTLAEMHGGRITASSPGPGQGSEFVLRLPAAGPPPGAERPAAAHPQPSQGLRILAVDDNLDLVTSMARLLRRAGHEVRTVTDGLSALAEARSYRPDVILLDIGLPGMDGYQVAAELKQDPSLAATTMIALSGYSQPEDRRRTSQAGFDHHLAKPVEAHELTRLLGRIRSPSL